MITTIVYINVKEDNISDFIEATIRNHEASIHETGKYEI